MSEMESQALLSELDHLKGRVTALEDAVRKLLKRQAAPAPKPKKKKKR